MPTDPIAFCESQLPALYMQARAALEAASQKGDAQARARLASIAAQPIHTRLRFAAEPQGVVGEVVLRTDRAGLVVKTGADAPNGFGYAVEVSKGAAMVGIGMLERGEVNPEAVARALLMLGSERACTLFAASRFAFDITVEHVPVLGTSKTRLAFGATELPPKPDFSVWVEYDELEDARERAIPPHQLFLAGKMRVEGDASAAMRLAMTLAQLT